MGGALPSTTQHHKYMSVLKDSSVSSGSVVSLWSALQQAHCGMVSSTNTMAASAQPGPAYASFPAVTAGTRASFLQQQQTTMQPQHSQTLTS
jgi:hypothetical protein